MKPSRSSVVLAVIGVLLIVAAAVIRFVVVPSVTELPTDLDVTLEFEGTYNGINPAVLSGGATEVLAEDVPIAASRNVSAESVDGDTEIVRRNYQAFAKSLPLLAIGGFGQGNDVMVPMHMAMA